MDVFKVCSFEKLVKSKRFGFYLETKSQVRHNCIWYVLKEKLYKIYNTFQIVTNFIWIVYRYSFDLIIYLVWVIKECFIVIFFHVSKGGKVVFSIVSGFTTDKKKQQYSDKVFKSWFRRNKYGVYLCFSKSCLECWNIVSLESGAWVLRT